MAHRTLTLTFILGLTVVLSACEQEQAAPSQSPQAGSQRSTEATDSQAEQHTTTGTVTAVDPSAGRVTLEHEPVPTLDWPAMTMQFKAADPGLLKETKVGDEIRFSFIQTEANEYIIQDISQQ